VRWQFDQVAHLRNARRDGRGPASTIAACSDAEGLRLVAARGASATSASHW